MDIALIKIIIDAGLVVLIWMVQIIIYPAFFYYSESELKRWHKSYTLRITYIVLPLMLGQLIIYLYLIFQGVALDIIINLVLVLLLWLSTFLISVPLHNKIDTLKQTMEARKKLVQTNWLRTFGWTLILVIDLIELF